MKTTVLRQRLFPAVLAGSTIFWFGCANQPTSASHTNEPHTASIENCAAQATAELGFDLYKRFNTDNSNIVFSPYSLSSALTVAYEGARSATAEEMRTVLHAPADIQSVRSNFNVIDTALNNPAKPDTLATANALWTQTDFPFNPAYLKITGDFYGCGLFNLDFCADPEASRTTINSWVEQKTHSRIQDLIPAGSLSCATKLVITNTVYLKAKWNFPFDSLKTLSENFTTASGAAVPAKMMHQTNPCLYCETDRFQMIELPFKRKDVAMVFILPKQNSLANFESAFSAGEFTYWHDSMTMVTVNLGLPRYKIEANYALSNDLKALGMTTAFQPGRADFSGMSDSAGLYIGGVLQKVFIEVCEYGTEAAAATAIILSGSSLHSPEPKIFLANHPFMFMIVHKPTGAILFMGRVLNPT